MPDPAAQGTAADVTVAGEHADQAFRRQLLATLPHLRAFARGLCGGRADQADDLVQETAIRSWAARTSFAEGTNFRAWTFRIMRNHFLNDIRRRKRETELDDETAARLSTRATQEDNLHLDDLQVALDRLPDERREALLLIGAGGFTYEEAASICEVATGTMKSRVARGRAALAQMLDASRSLDSLGLPAGRMPKGTPGRQR